MNSRGRCSGTAVSRWPRRSTERPKTEPLKGSCNLLVEQDLCSTPVFALKSGTNDEFHTLICYQRRICYNRTWNVTVGPFCFSRLGRVHLLDQQMLRLQVCSEPFWWLQQHFSALTALCFLVERLHFFQTWHQRLFLASLLLFVALKVKRLTANKWVVVRTRLGAPTSPPAPHQRPSNSQSTR